VSAVVFGVVTSIALSFAASACAPSADRIVAWDAKADLYVVATHLGRATPPEGNPPADLLALRRLTTGRQVALVNCASRPGALDARGAYGCDYHAFGHHVPPGTTFRRQGPGADRSRLAVRAIQRGDHEREFALMAKGNDGLWYRVLWLDDLAVPPETITLRIIGSEQVGDDVVLALEGRHQGGGCRFTDVQMLRVRKVDLEKPAASERQAHLLGLLKISSPLSWWRTAAEIAPLPSSHLIVGMVAAVEAGRTDFAVRWWKETLASLPVTEVAPVTEALRERPELEEVRQQIDLPPP
jgi:hypothetical protein